MKSKTSFCNGIILRKDLTRFAPLWILYALCLLLGLALLYVNDSNKFWFANNIGELIHGSSLINLFYAPLVAMLLFGDLFNSRMCNALHAMPLKRGCWFGSHIVAGLLFNLIPTAIFCALSAPLLARTCVVGGEWIALWAFWGMNLNYLCFFGLAVCSVFCAGNRFGMAAIYALFNGGAFIAYFFINSIYTPLLYGVITPVTLSELLTPVSRLAQNVCLEMDAWGHLTELYGQDAANIQAHFWLLPEGWVRLGIWAAVGILFMLLARLLYGRRNLECAGDAMAFRIFEPLFQICIAICAAAFGALILTAFFGYRQRSLQYLFVFCGLVTGWFAGKIIIQRTVRVFRLKNWLGLAALAAVLTGTLALVRFDVFGIETWTPAVEDVKSVTFGYSTYRGMSPELTDKEDISRVIRLQELALEDRLEESDTFVQVNGILYSRDEAEKLGLIEREVEYRYTSTVMINYTLNNGRLVQRLYTVWCDGEEAEIVKEYLSRWEVVSFAGYYGEVGTIAIWGEDPASDIAINIDGYRVAATQEDIDSLLAAIRADCDARTMTQRSSFHNGHFSYTDEYGNLLTTRSIYVEFSAKGYKSGSFSVFADSENTLKWLQEHSPRELNVSTENTYYG